jgi:superfamily II DNA or RNA helicase
VDVGERSVDATVWGTDEYYVKIELHQSGAGAASDARVAVSCTCPYFCDYGDYCKHIWATLLAVDDQCLLLTPPGRLTLESRLDDSFEEGFDDDDAGYTYVSDVAPPRSGRANRSRRAKTEVPQWTRLLGSLAGLSSDPAGSRESIKGAIKPIYILDGTGTGSSSELALSLAQQKVLQDGSLGKLKKLSLAPTDIGRMENTLDRHIYLMLSGAAISEYRHSYYRYDSYGGGPSARATSSFRIPEKVWPTILPMLFETGRFRLRANSDSDPVALERDSGDPWEFALSFEPSGKTGYALSPKLRRNGELRDIGTPQYMLTGDPALIVQDNIARAVNTYGCSEWFRAFSRGTTLLLKARELDPFLEQLSTLDRVPPLVLPDDWTTSDVNDVEPKPELRLVYDERATGGRMFANAVVAFLYDGVQVSSERPGATILDPQGKRQIRRDQDAEQRHVRRLFDVGVEPNLDAYMSDYRVRVRTIPELVPTLMSEGWSVFGNDKKYKNHSSVSVSVSSGIDWFELDGRVEFDGESVSIPDLLEAVRSGERFVKLGDASMGMLPEKWLAKFGNLLELGQVAEDRLRFTKTQIGLIDVLLAEMPEASFDRALATARRKLQKFDRIKPRQAPRGFKGALREYQEEGLGWLYFLRDLSWGGCLADDMGLGKTVQVLALLRDRRRASDHRCSLIVVPKSIVFNWMREAERFAPALTAIDYTGIARKELRDRFDDADLVVTTYGTMKRDIEFLADRNFDYVVLDEAQAIKNPNSQNAKAARILQASHRLVVTGTPVENRLEDLWSLFEFLNPGMLGSSRTFSRTLAKRSDQLEETDLAPLRRMLRPFILRRTKQQVAPDLPERIEQVVDCSMTATQAKYYKELRDYYRASLLKKVEKVGLAKSKIHVLEALLRLRQAACHPGLIDKSRADEKSGKLEAMIPMIQELVSEGHKALIFSQFTTMLGIIRDRLDQLGITYEYLDGKTRKRRERIDRFQNESSCPLFLISLKAGGVGLNLTAADYVFIVDPWWNPAVETQAIDRTHRIGQVNSVMAYRLITRDSVESRIMELQQSKRELANAVITQANSLIRNLTREDLDVLLS